MTSQDDLGMLWYGVSGVAFNPSDPSEVMLNTGTTSPLLSDHPRPMIAPQATQTAVGSHQAITAFGDPAAISHHSQMLYDPNTGDYISQADYMYEAYDSYNDETIAANALVSDHQNSILLNDHTNSVGSHEDDPNSQPKTKKPKVHQHPALKLKTPIAYQKDTDLNAIPIMKEGMAVCEKCGAIGVRHAFYGKERKYCSLACARPPMQNSSNTLLKSINTECSKGLKYFSDAQNMNEMNNDSKFTAVPLSVLSSPESIEYNKESTLVNNLYNSNKLHCGNDYILQNSVEGTFSSQSDNDSAPENQNLDVTPSLIDTEPVRTLSQTNISRTVPSYLPNGKLDLGNSFEWELTYLSSEDFVAAPVQNFKHAPMSECWEQISAGMKVEVSCREESVMKDSFWVATVIDIAGYKARLRYEGFVDDDSKDFWVDLCSEEVHPVGWCATQSKPLIPPKSIQYKYKDWKEFLMRRLTGARTLPTNFQSKVVESQKSRFRPGLNLEVVDKNRIAQMRVATVTEVIGKRLHLRYHGAPPNDNGFWCHEDSSIIHPVGWSREVGHEIVASQSYHEKCMEVSYDPDDAAPELFIQPKNTTNRNTGFMKGMKVEAIDPLNLATICVATIMKVLSHNYLMIRIDSYDSDNTNSDWFCYHASSPCIFPAGFCEMNSISLTPPRGYEGQFSWYDYLNKTQSLAAPPALFDREIPNHGFSVGMSLEGTDVMDPRLVCVATVKEVKGRLLKIHFDGWEADFDQWVDCQSPDIYPAGWCKMVGYKLEGPRMNVPVPFAPKRIKRGRGIGRKGRAINRRGMFHRDVENASPVPQSLPVPCFTGRRGRKPRLRGYSNVIRATKDVQEYSLAQEFSTELNIEGSERNVITKGRRGRPRKNPLTTSNHPVVQIQRPARTARAAYPSYTQSEDEGSDDTSSGVASLADSETSADCWDTDNISKVVASDNNIPNMNRSEENTEMTIASLASLQVPDTAYRDCISDFLTGDEGPSLDTLFSSAEDGMESLPLPENSSDFQVSSSLGTQDNYFEPPDVNDIQSFSNGEGPSFINSISTSTTSSSTSPFNEHILAPPVVYSGAEEKYISSVSSNTSLQETSVAALNVITTTTTTATTTATTTIENTKECFIPRIIDNSHISKGGKIQPKLWSAENVSTFLRINDCGSYCNSFLEKLIDGNKLLKLSQNEVLELTGMKVGPSLKIHDLIQQLLAIVNPAQARYQATLMKRGLAFGKS